MMLELLLTRTGKGGSTPGLREALFENLRFVVFDELHTYRGRQGADVGMLIRRIRAKATHAATLVCVGTSATMSSGGTLEDQRVAVAKVAAEVFGTPFGPEAVIQEYLTRRFTAAHAGDALRSAVLAPVDGGVDEATLKLHPTPAWLESEIALAETEGRLVRNRPITFRAIVEKLHEATQCGEQASEQHLKEVLLWISEVNRALPPERKRYAYMPFKLHQFLSQTGAVLTSLEPQGQRYITLEAGYHVPGGAGASTVHRCIQPSQRRRIPLCQSPCEIAAAHLPRVLRR